MIAQPQPTQPASLIRRPQSLNDLQIPEDGRGLAVGETGGGKSVLIGHLLHHWRQNMTQPRILIVDTKPRFRATHELNGLTTQTTRRYRGMKRGEEIPHSVVLPAGVHVRSAMQQAWRLGFDTVIAQHEDAYDWHKAAVHWFYRDSKDGYHQLVVVDELADFFGTAGAFSQGHPMVRVVRSGRERGVAFLAGTQRPKGIPKAVLTELSNIYIFRLAYEDDMEHLREMGLPLDAEAPDLENPADDYAFYFYSKKTRMSGKTRLKL